MEQLFHKEADLEGAALDELEAKVSDLTGHELSTAIRNLAVSRSLSVEKSAPIRNEPTQIVSKSADDIRRALTAKGFVLEGTAEDETDETR